LALQVVERQSEIGATLRNPGQIKDMCESWKRFRGEVEIFQDDSGV